ncbi:50S ribosomal protein L16 [Sneathia vaginalis]|jgi:ribosomal protein L16|uniref:Large ribosomal subunit protein uL16 n=1 Tax=Sneathia vaginalis TaxID=187101 RepID=A0A0E3UTG7_9FUSO|nr:MULTISPECIES: 50S ribosomal protein L16 [Sneathia]AKC95084.1 50S ribosomal protein L16 [Sneathia vaginalis]MBE2989420.1 50S ribosomal protein L16 [Sneathia sp. DSM 16630]MBE3031204.1 50S ribosomal protein L16 [Sneathia sp. DSM 16631]MDK9581536.1 50S ribosomal protein L16 [Sneathia vaginalis]
MLIPKRTKYRKQFRGKIGGIATKGNTVAFGEFGLAAKEFGWITSRQIEACRIAINRTFKREGKIWIRIFPDKPYTKRPEGTRMGKGKGNTEGWVAVVKTGKILFEVGGVKEETAKEALRKAGHKLPIKVKFVRKEVGGEN